MRNNKIKEYRSKKKLGIKERILIEHYYTKKKIRNYSYIGRELWRDRKTIEREIKRNGYYNRWWEWTYKADIAQKKTERRRKKANRRHIKLFRWEGKEFVEKIKKKMKEEGWSINAAIGRYEIEKGEKAKISVSTMYRYAREYDKEMEKLLLYKSWWYKKRGYRYWRNRKILEC